MTAPANCARGRENLGDGSQRLQVRSTIEVTRRKPPGRTQRYPMQVVADDGDHVVVAGRFSGPRTLALGYVSLEPSDWFVEHFWRSRWFTVSEVRSVIGALKGWYCDVTRPAQIDSGAADSEDLFLDVWVPGTNTESVLTLDRDEFEASDLRTADPVTYTNALRGLAELHVIVAGDGLPSFLRQGVGTVQPVLPAHCWPTDLRRRVDA